MRVKSCSLCGRTNELRMVVTPLGLKPRCFECRGMTLRFEGWLKVKMRRQKALAEYKARRVRV